MMLLAIGCICSAWVLGFTSFTLRKSLSHSAAIVLQLSPAIIAWLAGSSWTIVLTSAVATWHGARIRICGVTGTIASGKSTFSRLLAAKGAFIIDADEIARRVMQRGMPAFNEVVARFGTEAVVDSATGEIDRPRLRVLILADASARRFVNSATHMRIAQVMFQHVVEQRWLRGRVVVLDAPLLFETGGIALRLLCCPIVVVAAERETQVQRVMARDGVTRESAEASLAVQMRQEEKIARADVVVHNDGGVATLQVAADALYAQLTRHR